MNIIKNWKVKKQNKIKLSDLRQELSEIQRYLDHEGKMRGMCDYDDNDMKLFYSLLKKRDNKQKEINQFLQNEMDRKGSSNS